MVQDPCLVSSLTPNIKCFNCFSRTEKLAMRVWFLAQALKASGGTDFTNVNTLLNYVACLGCESDFALDSIETYIAEETAVDNGASFTGMGIADFRKAIKCFVCSNPKLLRAAELYLRCALNSKFSNAPILL